MNTISNIKNEVTIAVNSHNAGIKSEVSNQNGSAFAQERDSVLLTSQQADDGYVLYSASSTMKLIGDTRLNTSELPPSVFGHFELKDPAVSAINAEFESMVRSLIRSEIDSAELEKGIRQIYDAILQHNISLGRTDGMNAEDNMRVLSDVYRHVVFNANRITNGEMNAEGERIAAEYGLSIQANDRFVYYDAKYFYAFKAIKEAANQMIESSFTGCSFSRFFDSINSQSGMFNFNETFNGYSGVNQGICAMNNVSEEPPKGFMMFFSQYRYSKKDFAEGVTYLFTAENPESRGNEIDSVAWEVTVPRGAPLVRNNSKLTLADFLFNRLPDKTALHANLNSIINSSLGIQDSFYGFLEDNINNFDAGMMLLLDHEKSTEYAVPFKYYQNMSKNRYNAADIAPNESSYLSNFNFYGDYSYNYYHSL